MWNIPEEKYFAPLRVLYPFIKSFVKSVVDIALTFSDSSFNSFWAPTCFVLFELTFLFKFLNLSWKAALLTKIAMSFLVAKVTCANLAIKFSAVNLLNS